MANVPKMMTVEAIHTLRSAGLSCREIAKRLGIHRETVSRHLQLGQAAISKPASAPILPAGSESVVAGFGGPTGLVQASCEAMETPPGFEAQVDFGTNARHLHPAKINGLERGIAYLLGKVRSIGLQAHAWAEAVVVARGIEGHRVVQGLLALTKKHTTAELEKACETALANRCYRLPQLRQLIRNRAERQQPLEFLSEHPIIRPLEDYAAVVTRVIHRRQDRPSMGEGFGSHDTGIHSDSKDRRPASANLRGDGCLWSGVPRTRPPRRSRRPRTRARC